MVSSRQAGRGTRRHIGGALLAALVALPAVASAQSTGNGFLFKKPNGSFSMRMGYEAANTSSEPFTVLRRETTLGQRSLDAFNLGVDVNAFLTPRFDLVFTMEGSSRTTTAEYREWEENGNPITHASTLDRLAFGTGVRYNLVDRGRQISALAFIPARTIPYVGGNVGVLWYEFVQEGDFVEVVDDSTGNIFTDKLQSDNYSMMGQVYAGIERRLSPRWSLTGETRYTHSTAKLVKDYHGMGDIQLSGLALNIGVAVRF